MPAIRAIYENGVFRLLHPVDLPNGTEVELHNLRLVNAELDQDLDAIHKAMDQRFNSCHTDTAARHNEHQP
jgi:predicted DNA-binding antitoxin AbrB/MazE fold protein